MTIFDLLFLLAVLATGFTLAIVAIFFAQGKGAPARKILAIYALAAMAYLLTGIAIAMLKPQRVLHIGEPWCFDDWCLSVQEVRSIPDPLGTAYSVEFRIFSQAARVTQRAKGAWIYLLDEQGHIYSPDSHPSLVPLDIALRPHESVNATRVFHVPNGSRPVGLITGHGGSYCGVMSFLVIGDGGCFFGKPTMVGLQ